MIKRIFLLSKIDDNTDLSVGMYNTLVSGYNPPTLKSKEIQISPCMQKSCNDRCLFKSNVDSLVKMRFKHVGIKHKRLFLNLNQDSSKRIRMDINNKGYYEGFFFAPRLQCIKLSWEKTDTFSYPKSDAENVLNLSLLYY